MKDKLQQIREKAIAEIEGSDGLERLNEVRQAVLGKKGELTAVLKGMKDVAPEDRPKVGQWVNDTRSAIETILEEKMKKLEADALKKRYEAEKIDVTMPAVKHEKGNLHPVTQVRNQLIDIFASKTLLLTTPAPNTSIHPVPLQSLHPHPPHWKQLTSTSTEGSVNGK